MDKAHILSEIKRTAEENGGDALGMGRFEKETGIKPWDWRGKYWTKWGDALTEAGHIPNKLQSAYDPDFLLQKLIELIQELGHFPTATERRFKGHNDKSFPTHNTFANFGNKRDLIEAVINYSENNNVDDKIIEICKEEAVKCKPKKSQKIKTEQYEDGFVYLMKSGKYYKLGRSSCAEMRRYQLSILMPEKLELIHKIKTDDPVGIEKYWHERFKDKRKNGEWFDLTASDVKSFKRRKFM